MKLVFFKDLLEDDSDPQYGILTEKDEPEIICLCCGGTLEFGDYEVLEELPWFDVSAILKLNYKKEK